MARLLCFLIVYSGGERWRNGTSARLSTGEDAHRNLKLPYVVINRPKIGSGRLPSPAGPDTEYATATKWRLIS